LEAAACTKYPRLCTYCKKKAAFSTLGDDGVERGIVFSSWRLQLTPDIRGSACKKKQPFTSLKDDAVYKTKRPLLSLEAALQSK
jgi:hypothetical protein